jgi:hypothetical protein
LPLWAAAIGVLLAVNLVVLSVVLLRREGGAKPGVTPATTAATGAAAVGAGATVTPAARAGVTTSVATPPAPAATTAAPMTTADTAGDHFSPMEAAPGTYAPEIPLADGNTATEHAAPHRAPAAPRVDEEPDEVLPSIDEVNLTGAQALPELHLDVHVYATSASDRFVYINGHKYREGMRLAEGPILERIRRDGVVLNAGGIRFLLPRQ